jgi:hypothetical protein
MDKHSGLVQYFITKSRKIPLTVSCIILLLISACATTKDKEASRKKEINIEEQWGVRIESIRTSAAGNLIDFRYRILDSDKALPLVERKNKPYLIDQESGKTLGVPNGAKVGPLRQTVRYGKPKEDRIYFVLFGNPEGFVKPGDKVTVVIGDFRVANLVVE